jgi:hypothetical protein
MEQIGYSLIDGQAELLYWGDSLGQISKPDRVVWPSGDITEGITGPCENGSHKLVPRMGVLGDSAGVSVQADQVVVTYAVPLPTVNDVAAERNRRLALGFNYDFGDARGVHHIGTTDADMVGWGEVSTYAGALIDSGDVETLIAIATDTGLCQVTAPEWRAVEVAAAEFRQPLWAASFALMAQSPIPEDYTNDTYWT